MLEFLSEIENFQFDFLKQSPKLNSILRGHLADAVAVVEGDALVVVTDAICVVIGNLLLL